MSLNHLTSLDLPQPYLNPRVQNMQVDGKLTCSNIVQGLPQGTNGANNASNTVTFSVANTYVTASTNANNSSPRFILGMTAESTGLQAGITGDYLVTANITFKSSIDNSLNFNLGVNGVFSNSNYNVAVDVKSAVMTTVSLSGILSPNVNDIIQIGSSAASTGALTVYSWLIVCNRLSTFN